MKQDNKGSSRCYSMGLRLCVLIIGCLVSSSLWAQGQGSEVRCVLLEIYMKPGDTQSETVLKATQEYVNSHPGLRLVVREVTEGSEDASRLQKVAAYYRLPANKVPVIYGLNNVLHEFRNEADVEVQLKGLLHLEIFVRDGCQHCAAAKLFLPDFQATYPALSVTLRDIGRDSAALNDLNQLVTRYRTAAASTPVFHLCRQMVVGFDRPETTGPRLHKVLERWTKACPPLEKKTSSIRQRLIRPENSSTPTTPLTGWPDFTQLQYTLFQGSDEDDELPLPELPLPELPLPEGAWEDSEHSDELPIGDAGLPAPVSDVPEEIDLPVLGRVRLNTLGLPLFTIAVGLVDGFNPCAMWVLLFLLSILVNLKSRARIFAVAGTFVFVSGVAYFAFMAAWLNVFLLVGLLRPIQILLALLAIVVGSIHIKDFFAFKKGITLSIPESAKPGIYQRVSRIVRAENMTGAIIGAIVLAVLVNIIELLCTAGLPALYTQILTLQQLPMWKNYAYLGLYNVAYMFDDSLMVIAVVVTLGKHKMQETEGRWLKLVSGVVVLSLGLVLLFAPNVLL